MGGGDEERDVIDKTFNCVLYLYTLLSLINKENMTEGYEVIFKDL